MSTHRRECSPRTKTRHMARASSRRGASGTTWLLANLMTELWRNARLVVLDELVS